MVDKENIIYGYSQGCLKCLGKRHRGQNNGNWKGYREIPVSYFYSLKEGALARGISFEVLIEEIQNLWEKSGGYCALTGWKIEIGKTASLDRIQSEDSYKKENLQWVHKDINRMKNNYSQDRFIEVCRAVAERTN